MVTFLITFTKHSLYCAKYVYSTPSIVMMTYDRNGKPKYVDDFREAY